ncbi:ABC transporter substrate-binding protein [Peterkaempfera sp. SMS 1(5)a]|uniref:ABC transporter substrate-binding protein n=1 Tax=Peterkaempfera podocarpi TaxID=3232308 RepID=UPI003671DA54
MNSRTAAPRSTRRPRRFASALAALSATVLTGVGTLSLAPAAAAADQGSTLRVSMRGIGVDSLNPFLAYFAGAYDVFGSIYPALDYLDQDGNVKPYLADSWTSSADKLTWTFKIHQGLKWSDGKPITAQDAAWTLNLIMTNSTAATANGSLVSNFKSVTAPDASTLVISTKTPQANMLSLSVPINAIPIVPQHVWESHVADLGKFKNTDFPVVGYGPWTLTSYKTDQYAKFDANKSFQFGAPKFDHMVMQSFKNTDAAVAALRSGQLDYVTNLNPTQYKALKGQKGITTYQEAGNRWNAVELNAGAKTRGGKTIGTANPALADSVVRTAIATAMDKKTLVTKVEDGFAKPGVGYLPPTLPQYAWTPSDDEKIDFDLAKANQMLDGAGYTKGTDGVRINPKTKKPLELRLGIHSNSDSDTQVSTYISGWLKEIGIKTDIQSMSSTMLNDNLAKGDWDMLMDSWSTGPDPTYLLSIQTCAALPKDDGTDGSTDAFFCDPQYDSLFQAQQSQFDPAQRAATLGQMQSILYKGNSDIVLYYDNSLDALRSDRVTGLESGKADASGAYPVQSSFLDYMHAAPVGKSSGGSSSNGLLIGIGALVVVAVIGGAVVLKRRGSADERE